MSIVVAAEPVLYKKNFLKNFFFFVIHIVIIFVVSKFTYNLIIAYNLSAPSSLDLQREMVELNISS